MADKSEKKVGLEGAGSKLRRTKERQRKKIVRAKQGNGEPAGGRKENECVDRRGYASRIWVCGVIKRVLREEGGLRKKKEHQDADDKRNRRSEG